MRFLSLALATTALIASAAAAHAATVVRFTIQNLTPQGGNIVTQSSLLLHAGDFDIFNLGAPASTALERQAEDALRTVAEGSPQPGLLDVFQSYAAAHPGAQGLRFNGPTAIHLASGTVMDWLPGQTASIDVPVNPTNPNDAFFSLAFMFVPSNDAFWANDNPAAFRLFNADGSFNPISITVLGTDIYDAGTEVNDELRPFTAGLDQQFPNMGVTEGGVVHIHPGYNPPNGIIEDGGVLDDPRYVNAHFKDPGYRVALITAQLLPSAAPEPASWALMIGGMGIAGACLRRRRATLRVTA